MQDLTLVRNQTLESTIIVDNSPMAYMFQPENAIDCIRYATWLRARFNEQKCRNESLFLYASN